MNPIIVFGDIQKDNFDNVTLLLGNHDLHCFTDDICQSTRFDFDIWEIASVLYTDNFNCFQYSIPKTG